MAVFLIVVALAVGLGLLLGAAPDRPELRALSVCVLIAVPLYLAVIAWRPARLVRSSVLAPLFAAGVAGTVRITGAGPGTTQAAAVTLFSGFAPGATEPLRQAAVLAYSLAFQAAGTIIGVIGLLCLRLSTHPLPGSSGTPQSKL